MCKGKTCRTTCKRNPWRKDLGRKLASRKPVGRKEGYPKEELTFVLHPCLKDTSHTPPSLSLKDQQVYWALSSEKSEKRHVQVESESESESERKTRHNTHPYQTTSLPNRVEARERKTRHTNVHAGQTAHTITQMVSVS